MSAIGSAMHVEDLLSYIRTGESRSDLLERLTAEPGAPSGELLRAFAALTRVGGSPAEQAASSALEALSSAARGAATGGAGAGGVRFVERT